MQVYRNKEAPGFKFPFEGTNSKYPFFFGTPIGEQLKSSFFRHRDHLNMKGVSMGISSLVLQYNVQRKSFKRGKKEKSNPVPGMII